MSQHTLMKYDPATGAEKPYPSHADQWREYEGKTAAWLFDPWTGERRHAGDVGTDLYGHLILPPGEKLEPAISGPLRLDGTAPHCVFDIGAEFVTTGEITCEKVAPPRLIRKPIIKEGERYVGAIVRPDLTGYHLIRMSLEVGIKLTWKAAMDHAAEKGGKLPDRPEAALLFAAREAGEFADEWYWTREQHAGNDGFAWRQNFAYGYQNFFRKDCQHRAVIIRREEL